MVTNETVIVNEMIIDITDSLDNPITISVGTEVIVREHVGSDVTIEVPGESDHTPGGIGQVTVPEGKLSRKND